MTDFISTFERISPVLLGIFLAVFVLIILTRIILNFLLIQAYKKYQILKRVGKKTLGIAKKSFKKEDEDLMRKKDELPRSISEMKEEARRKASQQQSGVSAGYELMPSEEQEKEVDEVKVVDLVKPVGFWTSMIFGQKLTYLISSAQIINQRSHKGFWVSMIEAKERAAGKEHGRSL